MTSPRFLSVDDVLSLHALAIEDQGGDATVRDRGLLESAIATPAQQFSGTYLHDNIPSMAAAYAFHICKNHPFIDGNKRAATAAMIVFLHEKPKMELREFFARLTYEAITECLRAGLLHDNLDLAHKERFDTMTEAPRAIPAINQANLGAMQAEREGNLQGTTILRGQSHLLTAIYRIAQDMGYEW